MKTRRINNEVQAEFIAGRDATNGRLKSEGGSLYYKTKTPPIKWLEIARWSECGRCIWLWGDHTCLGAKLIVERLSYAQAAPSFHTYDFDNPVESARAHLKERADWHLSKTWGYGIRSISGHPFRPYAIIALIKYRAQARELHTLFGGPKVSIVASSKTLNRLAKKGVDIPLKMWAMTVEVEG